MSPTAVQPDARHRRRIHYVDERIQKWMLVGLVVMEVALAGAAVGVLNWQLTGIIEGNLYRVHLPEAEPLFDQLMQGAQKVLGMFILINVIALLVADAIWRHHVNSVVNEFMALIGKTGELDFSSDPEKAHGHEVLVLARTWRARERDRLSAIRGQLIRLEGEVSTRSDPRRIRELLDKLDELLP
jgi:hypothetical protein